MGRILSLYSVWCHPSGGCSRYAPALSARLPSRARLRRRHHRHRAGRALGAAARHRRPDAGVTRAKLAWYGALLLGIGVVGGVFRFLMRRILIGASRHIEYDMRNDFFAHLERLPLSLLPGAPDRRPDVAGHQRSERRPHDGRAGGDVLGRTRCSGSSPRWR